MAHLSGLLTRTIFVLCASVWGWVMVVVGLLAVFEWPGRFPVLANARYAVFAGGWALVAAGIFTFAVTIKVTRLFPQVHPQIAAMFEIFPWIGLAAVLLGGLV